jgi:iron complex transport system substrate-binding protein
MKKVLLIVIFILFFHCLIFAKDYQRIISLAPSATRSLYELGLDKEIIGITIFCPEGENKKEIIGTILEPNLEKIILLKPDLIVASKEGNFKTSIEKLQNLGFNVYVMDMSSNFDEVCKNFNLLADYVGRQNKANEEIEKSKAQVAAIFNQAKKSQKKSLFWVVGISPLYTCGKESFLNDYNSLTNTENIYHNLNARYAPVDMEDVIMKNPQIIIVASMDDNGKTDESRLNFNSTRAAKNGKIFFINPDKLFGLTPSSFADGLRILWGFIDDK